MGATWLNLAYFFSFFWLGLMFVGFSITLLGYGNIYSPAAEIWEGRDIICCKWSPAGSNRSSQTVTEVVASSLC